jgi:hypothetical protein
VGTALLLLLFVLANVFGKEIKSWISMHADIVRRKKNSFRLTSQILSKLACLIPAARE